MGEQASHYARMKSSGTGSVYWGSWNLLLQLKLNTDTLTHCQHLVLADSKTADCRGTVVTHSDASSSKVGRSKQKKSSLIPTWDLCQSFNWMLQSSSGWKLKNSAKTSALYSCQLLLRIHVIGYHWRSKVGEDCPSLPIFSSMWSSNPWSPQPSIPVDE